MELLRVSSRLDNKLSKDILMLDSLGLYYNNIAGPDPGPNSRN